MGSSPLLVLLAIFVFGSLVEVQGAQYAPPTKTCEVFQKNDNVLAMLYPPSGLKEVKSAILRQQAIAIRELFCDRTRGTTDPDYYSRRINMGQLDRLIFEAWGLSDPEIELYFGNENFRYKDEASSSQNQKQADLASAKEILEAARVSSEQLRREVRTRLIKLGAQIAGAGLQGRVRSGSTASEPVIAIIKPKIDNSPAKETVQIEVSAKEAGKIRSWISTQPQVPTSAKFWHVFLGYVLLLRPEELMPTSTSEDLDRRREIYNSSLPQFNIVPFRELLSRDADGRKRLAYLTWGYTPRPIEDRAPLRRNFLSVVEPLSPLTIRGPGDFEGGKAVSFNFSDSQQIRIFGNFQNEFENVMAEQLFFAAPTQIDPNQLFSIEKNDDPKKWWILDPSIKIRKVVSIVRAGQLKPRDVDDVGPIVVAALNAMPAPVRAAYILRCIMGLSAATTAKVFSYPVGWAQDIDDLIVEHLSLNLIEFLSQHFAETREK